MEKAEIEKEVFASLCEIWSVDPQKNGVSIEKAREEFYLDSISVIAMINEIEKKFSIEVSDEEVSYDVFDSFDNIVAFVEKKTSEMRQE